ncbi:PREDICTED: uncharacterized protein LOC106819450 [Priapulus caudatus]|uniref:Uncharacterized protein LOC106819450 n=1 Tax=Priapulus caudatus TaxID=37621 RepID=A0ABM1F547_PRICU|nr:PREDICTED: uncharacterized protein LOC106819450 [Priapulus caudatus]
MSLDSEAETLVENESRHKLRQRSLDPQYDVAELDQKLTETLQASSAPPPHQLPSLDSFLLNAKTDVHSPRAAPTLLHFCALYNLSQLCAALVRMPAARAALRVRNRDNETPAELARRLGHGAVAEVLVAPPAAEPAAAPAAAADADEKEEVRCRG